MTISPPLLEATSTRDTELNDKIHTYTTIFEIHIYIINPTFTSPPTQTVCNSIIIALLL